MKNFKKMIAVLLTFSMMGGSFGVNGISTGECTQNVYASDLSQDEMQVTNEDMEITGNDSFGTMMADVLTEEIEEQTTGEYYISGIDVAGSMALVNYTALADCNMVVAVYDEEGKQMLASGYAQISASKNQVVIDIETDSMPQYFLVKAFMMEPGSNKPLCSAFLEERYTKEFQEFLAKTTEDFEEEMVLNLDEDTDTNFAVFRGETIQIEESETLNQLVSQENGVYTIENAEASVLNLKEGDLFSYTVDEQVVMIKVKSVKVDGTTVTITEEADVELEEFFSYIKIESDNMEEVTVDNSKLEDGLTYVGEEQQTISGVAVQDIDSSAELTAKFNLYKYKKKPITLDVGITVTGKVTVYYNGFSDIKVEFSVTPTTKGSLKLEGEWKKNIKLAEFSVSPIVGVYIKFTPSIVLEATAAIEYDFQFSFTVGFGWGVDKGFYNASKKPVASTAIKIEGSLFVGVSMVPSVVILSKHVGEAKMTAKAGLQLTATRRMEASTQDDYKHPCSECLEGEIDVIAEISAEATFIGGKFKGKVTLLNLKHKLTDFYQSRTYDTRGFTTCPYISYKTTIGVNDSSGNPIEGIEVNCGAEKLGKTDEKGKLIVYLVNGTYSISVENPNTGKKVTRDIRIKDEGETKWLTLWGHKGTGDSDESEDDGGSSVPGGEEIPTITPTEGFSCDLQNITASVYENESGFLMFEEGGNLAEVNEVGFLIVEVGGELADVNEDDGQAFEFDVMYDSTQVEYMGYSWNEDFSTYFEKYNGVMVAVGDEGLPNKYEYVAFICLSSRMNDSWNGKMGKAIFRLKDGVDKAEFSICKDGSEYSRNMDDYGYTTPLRYVAPVEASCVYNANAVKVLDAGIALLEAKSNTYVTGNAVEGKDYLLAVVKDENAQELFAPENLLYIDQYTATEDGQLKVDYIPRDVTDTYKELLFEGDYVSLESEAADSSDDTNQNIGMKGDADGDGQVTLADAQITLKAALKIITTDELDAEAADVDGVPGISLADAQMILKAALKIIKL